MASFFSIDDGQMICSNYW